MKDINHVVLVGRIVKDVLGNDFSYTSNGTACLKTTVATNDSVRKGGMWKDEVNYFDIIIWGKTAEKLQSYLKKGKQVALSGRLQQQRWQSKDGNNKSRIVVIADTIQLLSGKKDELSGERSDADSVIEPFIDDIPFDDVDVQTNQQRQVPKKDEKPQLKGGESTPEEKQAIIELLTETHEDGTPVFSKDEQAWYRKMRQEITAEGLIKLLVSEVYRRKKNKKDKKNPGTPVVIGRESDEIFY